MSTRSDTQKGLFLEALAQTGNVTLAAEHAGVNRTTPYGWRDNSDSFAAKWYEAIHEAGDRLEAEARRRAVEGTQKPVYQGGKLVGHVQEYSDTLLIFLMKGANPEKYREVREVRQKIEGSVEHHHSGLVETQALLAEVLDAPDAP
jgi:hypothetical protein